MSDAPEQPEKPKQMTMELYVIYLDGRPRAVTLGTSAEDAENTFRMGALGRAPEYTTLKAVNGWDTPLEDFVKITIGGLYMRIFQADMAQAMAQRGRRH
jgi:hypothetical protein